MRQGSNYALHHALVCTINCIVLAITHAYTKSWQLKLISCYFSRGEPPLMSNDTMTCQGCQRIHSNLRISCFVYIVRDYTSNCNHPGIIPGCTHTPTPPPPPPRQSIQRFTTLGVRGAQPLKTFPFEDE